MSRRLIIIILVILIVGIVGGTAFLLISRFRNSGSGTAQDPDSSGNGLQESETGTQQVVDPTGDDDGDGLNNADERTWGTDPNNPDTDGDGFLDGDEVKANHNPTIAGPNDALPVGFKPGRELAPLEVAGSEPVAVDQFFSDDLDLSGPPGNLTEDYNKDFNENERNVDTLGEFVRSQSIVTQLPQPARGTINVQGTDSPASIRTYLNTAGNLTVFSNLPLFQSALADTFGNGDPSSIRGVAITVRNHQANLIELSVPPTAQNLHRLLLGYSEIFAATLDQIALYNEDKVRATLGVRQWEEIDAQYMPLIEQEVARLEALAP